MAAKAAIEATGFISARRSPARKARPSILRAAACLLLACAAPASFAQTNPCRTSQPVATLGSSPVAQATVVYDPNQNVCWLADADLAGNLAMQTALGVTGIF